MRNFFIAFGGNLGAVPQQLEASLDRIRQLPDTRLVRRSRLFQTTPIGSNSGDPYFNAAAQVESKFAPVLFLKELQKLEHDAGRKRGVHWGPRVLDLDLIAADDLIVQSAFLTLPHPHCWYRRFVLDPWGEIAPDYVHPLLGESVSELRERLFQRPLPVALQGPGGDELLGECVSAVSEVQVTNDDSPAPAITFATSNAAGAARVVDVSTSDDPCDLVVQVLRAALDQPVAMTQPGAPWTSTG
jgi:2-amino-4-hydroxy-6-hydroxymethyldihydropteridine diphosphokinase